MTWLVNVVHDGVPVDVTLGGNLDESTTYGGNLSAGEHREIICKRLMEDITYGRVVVLHKFAAEMVKYVRVSPVARHRKKARSCLGSVIRCGRA